MPGYQPAGLPSGLIPASSQVVFERSFEESLRHTLHLHPEGEVIYVPMPDRSAQMMTINRGCGLEARTKVVEYCDYFEVKESDEMHAVGTKLGSMAGSAYNALLKAAMRKYGFGVHVLDLFQNDNIRAKLTAGQWPSVSNPEGSWEGWASWRFAFAAGVINGRS